MSTETPRPATASALTVAEASRLYANALEDYEAALLSRDVDRRATAEARLQATAQALSQAQGRHVAARTKGNAAPSWDALLADPTQQFDTEGVVIASIPAVSTGGDQFATLLRNANQRARDWQTEARNWRLRAEAAEARERTLRNLLGEV